jgi:hypothetical protein
VTTPDGIRLDRHRDQRAASRLIWARRVVIAALTGFVLAALAGVFGQQSRTSTVAVPAATLTVEAPTRLRGNVIFQGRFTIRAAAPLAHATLVLDDGWTDAMSINTIEPAALRESSRDGKLALDYGHVRRGASLVVFMQLQVNPTNVGRRSQSVTLADGERELASVDRMVTVFP